GTSVRPTIPVVQPPNKGRETEQREITDRAPRITLADLSASYSDHQVLKGIGIEFESNQVTAIIGPSGCGKSTLIRCVNRMHEEITGATVSGSVKLDDVDLYGPESDPVAVRS